MDVIPVINCHRRDFECVQEKTAKAKKFLKKGDWLHLDVGDGRFTFNKTWQNPTEWANLRSEFNLEVHLMVEDPGKYISQWVAAGAKRFIFHVETLKGGEMAHRIIVYLRKKRAEAMLGSAPLTPLSKIWPYLRLFSHFQVLAVDPGPAGQKFLPVVLHKIKFLRNFAPNAMIEVDGGVNPETAKMAKAAGADTVASATYIFNTSNPKKAYKKLRKI
jgi:ribulose-phosphate 3-epimerase